jgi:outer membrane protein
LQHAVALMILALPLTGSEAFIAEEPAPGRDQTPIDQALASGPVADANRLELNLITALRLAFSQGVAKRDAVENLELIRQKYRTVRADYGPQFSGNLETGVGNNRDADGTFAEPLTDQQLRLGLSQSLPTGGSLNLDGRLSREDRIDNDSGARRDPVTSSLSLSYRQPLLRDAGPLVWRDQLTQAEREYIYALRSHRLFLDDLALETANRFWRLQQQGFALERRRDAVANARFALEQAKAFVEIGRSTANDVLRAEVQVLSAEQSYTDSLAAYERSLDEFRLDLNLPAKQDLSISEHSATISRLLIDNAVAIDLALQHRLDWLTEQDRYDDKRRSLRLATRRLLPDLDFEATVGVVDNNEDYQPDRGDDPNWSARLELEIPFHRRNERLNHQRALVALSQGRRGLVQFRQRIINEVTDAVRAMRRSESTFIIQRRQVSQSTLRLEKSQMDFEAGLISNRDLLEAQAEMREAQIGLYRARIDYRLAELELRKTTGQLQLDENGEWSDRLPAYAERHPERP